MSLRTRIIGAVSTAMLLAVPAFAVAALQPASEPATPDSAATLAVVEGAQPMPHAAAVASHEVVDLSDWQYTGQPANPGNRPQSPHEQGRGRGHGYGHDKPHTGKGHDKHH